MPQCALASGFNRSMIPVSVALFTFWQKYCDVNFCDGGFVSGEHVGNGNSNGNGGDSDVDVVVGNGVERKRCGYFFASTTHIRAALVGAIM